MIRMIFRTNTQKTQTISICIVEIFTQTMLLVYIILTSLFAPMNERISKFSIALIIGDIHLVLYIV
jgi:hypothetical protein